MAASKKYRLKLMRAKCTQRRQGCTKCGKYSENYLFKYNCKDSQRNSVANETPHAFCTQPSLLLYTCIESNTNSNEMSEAVKRPPSPHPLLVSNCSGIQFENFLRKHFKAGDFEKAFVVAVCIHRSCQRYCCLNTRTLSRKYYSTVRAKSLQEFTRTAVSLYDFLAKQFSQCCNYTRTDQACHSYIHTYTGCLLQSIFIYAINSIKLSSVFGAFYVLHIVILCELSYLK